jgi:hypothetical protein
VTDTIDVNKLDTLLKYFEEGQISKEQAQELKLLLEALYKTNLDEGDIDTARDIRSILITLKGFLSGMISLKH